MGSFFDKEEKKYSNPLHLAVERGDEHLLSSLVAQIGPGEIDKFDQGRTALHLAADKSQIGLVQLLVESKADVNIHSKDTYRTALLFALTNKNIEIVKYLSKISRLNTVCCISYIFLGNALDIALCTENSSLQCSFKDSPVVHHLILMGAKFSIFIFLYIYNEKIDIEKTIASIFDVGLSCEIDFPAEQDRIFWFAYLHSIENLLLIFQSKRLKKSVLIGMEHVLQPCKLDPNHFFWQTVYFNALLERDILWRERLIHMGTDITKPFDVRGHTLLHVFCKNRFYCCLLMQHGLKCTPNVYGTLPDPGIRHENSDLLSKGPPVSFDMSITSSVQLNQSIQISVILKSLENEEYDTPIPHTEAIITANDASFLCQVQYNSIITIEFVPTFQGTYIVSVSVCGFKLKGGEPIEIHSPLDIVQSSLLYNTESVQLAAKIRNIEPENGIYILSDDSSISQIQLVEWAGEVASVKILRQAQRKKPGVLDRFREEIRFLSKYGHPNIITCYGGSIGESPFVLMELMDTDLSYLIEQKDPCLVWHDMGNQVALDIAKGLHYLHSLQPPMCHKDLKSPNCLIRKTSNSILAKISDFGTSKFITSNSITTQRVYSLKWASPEQIDSTKPVASPSDIYSFGIILWEIISLSAPWQNKSEPEIMNLVTQGHFANHHPLPTTCSQSLQLCLLSCWKKNPLERPNIANVMDVLSGKEWDKTETENVCLVQ